MKLKIALRSVVVVASLSGCGKQPPPESTSPSASEGQESVAHCGSDAPATAEHCACLGGYVRGDIGDGQVACPQGETQLERVNQGIEGAVCCAKSRP